MPIVWPEASDVPEAYRDSLSGNMVAIATTADGACALHAVFGTASAAGPLVCPRARHFAVRALERLWKAAPRDHRARDYLNHVQSTFWTDFAKGAAAGEDIEREGEIFWEALQKTDPQLADEAKN